MNDSQKFAPSPKGLKIFLCQTATGRNSLRRRRMQERLGNQKLIRTPSCAENGVPTVVPGPKKSPRAPAGTFKSPRLRIDRVTVQVAFRQMCIALASSPGGTGSAEMSGIKLFPGLVRFSRLKNSTKGLIVVRSPQ